MPNPIKIRPDFSSWAQRLSSYGVKDRYRQTINSIHDFYNYYGGVPLKTNYLQYSEYSPSISKDKSMKYISNQDPIFKEKILKIADIVFNKEKHKELNISNATTHKKGQPTIVMLSQDVAHVSPFYDRNFGDSNTGLGTFTLSRGKDEKGEYISYYDHFDAYHGGNKKGLAEFLKLVKPYEIYDRIYLSDINPKLTWSKSLY